MRLNFSGVGEEEIAEGIKRIGKVIAEQIDLYEALTASAEERPESAAKVPPVEPEEEAADRDAAERGGQRASAANVLPFRKAAGP